MDLKVQRFLRILLAIIISLFCLIGNSVYAAPADPLTLPAQMETITPYVKYYRDADWSQTIETIHGDGAPEFTTVESRELYFGYTKDKIWLKMDVRSPSSEIAEWRLHINENFYQDINIYIAREDATINHILAQDINSVFSTRPIAYHELVAPLSLAPQEQVTIYIAYWSEGSSQIDFNIISQDDFSNLTQTTIATSFFYYGVMFAFTIAAFLSWLLWRAKEVLAYIFYAIAGLLLLTQIQGVAFQYIWPNAPQFNSIATVFIGGALAIACANFARILLRTRQYHPRLDKALLGIIWITIITILAGSFADMQFIKRALVMWTFLAILIAAIAGVVAGLRRFREVRFYIFAWSFAVFAAFLKMMNEILGVEIPQAFEFDIMRITIVLDALMLGFGIADRYNYLRRSRNNALAESLSEARRNLDLSSRLYELEEQYALATQLAVSKDQNIQNTVHDLRQPLQALRLSIKKLEQDKPQDAVMKFENMDSKQIDETFIYLETLISTHLQYSVAGGLNEPIANSSDFDEGLQALTVPKILSTVYEMFLPDANKKGLEFIYIPTSHTSDIDPLALMRITTNLVSNAIKYTERGKVVLGTRRRAETLTIQVHDSGPGMSALEFEYAQKRRARLNNTKDNIDGQGYGLAIAKELATQHDMELSLCPKRKSGSGLIISLPRPINRKAPHIHKNTYD